NSRVSVEEQTGGRIWIHFADLPRRETGQAEGSAAPVFVGVGERRFPAQPVVQSDARRHMEGVLHVYAQDRLPQVVRCRVALLEIAWPPEQKIGQTKGSERPVECKGPILLEAGDRIVLHPDEVEPESDLV